MDWIDDAACRTTDIDFIPPPDLPRWDAYRLEHAAKAICATCAVRNPCLLWALDNQEFGIWGGTTANERARMRGVKNKQSESVGTHRGPRTPEAVAIYQVLADGEWHHRTELVDAVHAVLTEERALQHASTGHRTRARTVTPHIRRIAAQTAVSNTLSPLVRKGRIARNDQHFRLEEQ